MSKIKSLPGQRLCSSLPRSRPLGNERSSPATDTIRPSQPRALKALELALHIHTAGYNILSFRRVEPWADLHAPGISSPASARPQTPPDLLYVNNFDDPIVPCCCPSRRGRAKKAAFGPFAGAGGYPRTARPSGQREVRQEAFRIAGSFSGRAFRAHQADGQDRRERGLQPRYG